MSAPQDTEGAQKKIRSGDSAGSPDVTKDYDATASCIPSPPSQEMSPAEYEKNLETVIKANPYLVPVWPEEVEGKPVPLNVDTLMQYGGFVELRLIIDWAKQIHSFRSLQLDEQMALLKASFLELNVLRLAFRTMPYVAEKKCKFAENLILRMEDATTLGWGLDLISCTMDFSRCLNDGGIDRTEFAILSAIVLSFPDAVGIKDKTAVTNLQKQYLDLLRQYIVKTYPDNKNRYGKLLLKLPLLRTTSAKGAERFLKMTLDGTIQLNNLVWEMMS